MTARWPAWRGDGVTDAQDLAEAAALFRPEWEHTEGVDGYVSLEVPPDVAYDAAEQAHSPRTGPRCLRRSKKRRRSLRNTPEAKWMKGHLN